MAHIDHRAILMGARWGSLILGPGPRIWWRLFDQSKISAIASVTVQTLATLLTAIAARSLGQIGYGQLATLTTCAGWFYLLASYPTATLVPRYIADDGRVRDRYARKCATALYLSLGFTALAVLVGLPLLRGMLARYQLVGLQRPAVLIVLGWLPLPLSGFSVYLLQCFGRMRQWALMNVLFGVLPIACVSAAAGWVRPLTIDAYIIALTVSGVISAAIGMALSVRLLTWRCLLRPDFSVARPLLRHGFGGWVANWVCQLAQLGISTLIALRVGRTELGHYQLVGTIGSWVYALVVSVTVPALAQWSALGAAGRLANLRRSLRFRQLGTGSLSVLLGLLAVAFAPQILRFLYGDAYAQNALLLRVSTIAWIAQGFSAWYWIALTALKHPGRVMLPNAIWGIGQIALAGLLLWATPLGVLGAMIAYVVAYVAWALAYEEIYRRTMHAEAARRDDPAAPPAPRPAGGPAAA